MDAIKEYLRPELIWFFVGLGLLLGEFMVPGLVIFFFGIGAWVTALVCWLTHIGINLQLLVFLIVSAMSLLVLRKWLKGIFYGHVTGQQELTEDFHEFIGERAVVTQAITPKSPGKVELHGTEWPACSHQELVEGTAVKIIDKKNITLTVESL